MSVTQDIEKLKALVSFLKREGIYVRAEADRVQVFFDSGNHYWFRNGVLLNDRNDRVECWRMEEVIFWDGEK